MVSQASEVPVEEEDNGSLHEAESVGSEPDGTTGGGSNAEILRLLAETQRQMANHMSKDNNNNNKGIANVRLLPFDGNKNITTQQYQEWKKDVYIKKDLYGIKDNQLSQLIYSQVTGEAKLRLRVMTIDDLKSPNALNVIWQIFDKVHAKTEKERADKAYEKWDNMARKHGQDFADYCAEVRLARLEAHTQDPEKRISNKELFSKILRGSGLSQKDKAQVEMNCGDAPDPDRIETVLVAMFPHIGKSEKK